MAASMLHDTSKRCLEEKGKDPWDPDKSITLLEYILSVIRDFTEKNEGQILLISYDHILNCVYGRAVLEERAFIPQELPEFLP